MTPDRSRSQSGPVAVDPNGIDIEAVTADFTTVVHDLGDPARAAREKTYLKSELEHYGVRVPVVRGAMRKHLLERTPPERKATIALTKALWKPGVHELRVAAVDFMGARQSLLKKADVTFVEDLLRDARTWALVDGLAPNVAWPLVDRHPELHATLVRWSADPDFWIRRSALLTYLLPMRRGAPVFDSFTALAEPLLCDREFFIRKAIGWVLRERSKKAPDEVYQWLLPRRSRASGLTVREASKYLNEAQRNEILGR